MTNPTTASFYTDGEQLVEGTIVSNDYTPSTTPSQAPSSLYPEGTAYQVSNPDVAEDFASQAAASAAAALASKNASHTSEVNAAASDADATTQAATATTQAGIATTGGTTATTQAGIATTQAGIATTKAAAASTSETNAAASAANAASHDASAATHDSNASTSATNAATSATNAAASAASASSDVNTAIANLVNSAPSTLDTLKELADALGDDPNFATTMTNALALKAPLASPALTGTPAAPTAAALTNTTQIATTAYSDAAVAVEKSRAQTAEALLAPLASPALTGTPSAPTATAGTNTTQIATTAFVLANGSSSGVSSLNGQTGALVSYFQPQGRLTLVTGTPVMTTTQSAKTAIYYTPYHGDIVPIYNGTNMVPTAVAEISVATTDTTKSPAAIGASKVNDWFVWNDAGTIRLGHGPDWTNDTTRSAGTALVMVNGIYLNNASITNGPAASRGTYVGTTRSNASSQLDWIFGGLAAGGTASFFGVFNAYNRVDVSSFVGDTGNSWTYATATWQSANASASMRVTFVRGLAEEGVTATYAAIGSSSSSGTTAGAAGIGVDSTSAFSGTTAAFNATAVSSGPAIYSGSPGLGVHFTQAIEYASGATMTFYGSNATVYEQSGMHFRSRM